MRSVWPLLAGCLLVVLAGCGGDGGETGADPGNGAVAEYVLCSEADGTWTDLTGEDQEVRGSVQLVNWTDEDRCAIRLDTVWHTFGDDHCDWQAVEFISIGLPIGTPFTGDDAVPPGQDWTPQFFFNTDGIIEGWPPGERLSAADLPADAIDTGLRTVTNRQLFVAGDETALYEIQGDSMRVFTPSEDQINCA